MTKAFEAEEKSLNELMMDNAGNLAYATLYIKENTSGAMRKTQSYGMT